MADPMNFVTVDELSVEIQKHTDSHILPELLALLRAKDIDLREFCKRVRMVLGAEVLINTVRGLQHSQQHKNSADGRFAGECGRNGAASRDPVRHGQGQAPDAAAKQEPPRGMAKLEDWGPARAPAGVESPRGVVASLPIAGISAGSSGVLKGSPRAQPHQMMHLGALGQGVQPPGALGQGVQAPGALGQGVQPLPQMAGQSRQMAETMAVAFGPPQARSSPTIGRWSCTAAGPAAVVSGLHMGGPSAAQLMQVGQPGSSIGPGGAVELRQMHSVGMGCLSAQSSVIGSSCSSPLPPRLGQSDSFDIPQLQAILSRSGGLLADRNAPELSVKIDALASSSAPPNPLGGPSHPSASDLGDMDSPGKSALRDLKEMSTGGGDGHNSHVPATFKVLIHALLCPKVAPAQQCSMDGCAKMKGLLSRVEHHTKSCAYASQQPGMPDCTTCAKWRQMEQLREHYRRKLIAHSRQINRPASGTPPPGMQQWMSSHPPSPLHRTPSESHMQLHALQQQQLNNAQMAASGQLGGSQLSNAKPSVAVAGMHTPSPLSGERQQQLGPQQLQAQLQQHQAQLRRQGREQQAHAHQQHQKHREQQFQQQQLQHLQGQRAHQQHQQHQHLREQDAQHGQHQMEREALQIAQLRKLQEQHLQQQRQQQHAGHASLAGPSSQGMTQAQVAQHATMQGMQTMQAMQGMWPQGHVSYPPRQTQRPPGCAQLHRNNSGSGCIPGVGGVMGVHSGNNSPMHPSHSPLHPNSPLHPSQGQGPGSRAGSAQPRRAQFGMPLASPTHGGGAQLPMSSARPIETTNVAVLWGHVEPVLGDASNSPLLASLPKAMGVPADDMVQAGSFSRQSSGSCYDMPMAMRAPAAAAPAGLACCGAPATSTMAACGAPAAAVALARATVAAAPQPQLRRGGKQARPLGAASGKDGCFPNPCGPESGFPAWASGASANAGPPGPPGPRARLPMMEFGGFAPGMSPTMGMGTMGMGRGDDDMGISEEYNDLSWLESELDQREVRLGVPEDAPAFSLAVHPGGAQGSRLAPGLTSASLAGKPAKRKPTAAPRRRAKAAKSNPESGKGGHHGGGKGSGPARGEDAEASLDEDGMGSDLGPLHPEGSGEGAKEAQAAAVLSESAQDATEDTSLLGAIDTGGDDGAGAGGTTPFLVGDAPALLGV